MHNKETCNICDDVIKQLNASNSNLSPLDMGLETNNKIHANCIELLLQENIIETLSKSDKYNFLNTFRLTPKGVNIKYGIRIYFISQYNLFKLTFIIPLVISLFAVFKDEILKKDNNTIERIEAIETRIDSVLKVNTLQLDSLSGITNNRIDSLETSFNKYLINNPPITGKEKAQK